VQLEADVAQASGPRQRRLLNKIGTLDFPFVFDLSNVALVGSPPATVEDLKRMLQDAEFSEVAQHLAVSGLNQLEDHWMVERALKHAYVQMGEAAFAARAKVEHGVISWRWPSVRYINTVRLEFSKEGKSILVEEVQRDFVQSSTERSLTVPGGGNVTTVLRFGTRSPSGRTFWVDSATRLKFAVPAQPLLPSSQKVNRQATLVDSQSLALQLQHDQELQRLTALNDARFRRRRIATAMGGSAAVAAAVVTTLLLWPVSETIDLCQIPTIQSSSICGQNLAGPIDVADRFGLP
jgi:hypothetical protein